MPARHRAHPSPFTGGLARDLARLRSDFPALRQVVRGRPLAYLDNAATSQKPAAVIEAIGRFYREDNANVHRGVHELSQRATAGYESARSAVQRFLNAREAREIIFVRGATEAINLVAQSWGRANLRPGDEIVVSILEHHSNIVPWQIVCQEKGARLRVIPMDDRGVLDLDEYERLLGESTRLVAVTHASNALGTVNPVAEMVRMAHDRGALVLVDGAQAASHLTADVQAIDPDFYVISGHKIFGPTGIGVLYGRASLLDAMPPWQGGGDMISSVTLERTLFNDLPYKFEAGTPHIAGAIGLATAIDYIRSVGLDRIAEHEAALLAYATEQLACVPGVRLLGTAPEKVAIVSFVLDNVHPHDVGTILDQQGVAIRAGHHCCQPLMARLGVPATARASFAFYNSFAEVDALVAGVQRAREVFG